MHMGRPEERFLGRRLKTSYATTVASMTLVLFMLGLLGVVILYARTLSEHVRENIGITVFLHDQVSDDDAATLATSFERLPAIRSVDIISREAAAESLMEELGEDFISFLGYNPLPASLLLMLHAAHAHPDSLPPIKDHLMGHAQVAEVDYRQDLVYLVNENVRKIGLVLLGLSLLLVLIAYVLVSNTIRLGVFSRRFLIKSMQLVGATRGFIRRPFLSKGLIQGLIASLLANAGLAAILYVGSQQVPELLVTQDLRIPAILFASVTLLGLLISWIATALAVRKYLNIQTDSLYIY